MDFSPEFYEEQMKRLQKDQQKAKDHSVNLGCSESLFDLYQSFQEAGFTDEQAWEILMAFIKYRR